MSDYNAGGSQISLSNLETLSFDSFGRNPNYDIVCVTPVRTVVRREEEIVLVRRVRKVEEIDASPACPVNTSQMAAVQQDGQTVYQAMA
jgi:hypothetical protein